MKIAFLKETTQEGPNVTVGESLPEGAASAVPADFASSGGPHSYSGGDQKTRLTPERDFDGVMRGIEDLLNSPQPQPSGSGQGDVRVRSTVPSKEGDRNANPKSSTSQPNGSDEDGFSTAMTKSMKKRLKKRRQQAARKVECAQASGSGEGPTFTRRAKTKRQNTDPDEKSQQRPAKRPFLGTEGPRNSAKEQSDLALMIFRKDGEPVDEIFAATIRKKFRELLVVGAKAGIGGECLSFATSGLVSEGFFLLTPMSAKAREWALSQDFGEHNGVEIGIRNLDRDRVSIWVPGKKEDHFDQELMMMMIQAQNSHRFELRVKEWVLLSRTAFPLGERLVVGIPQGILAEDKDHVWISLEGTQVQARLIKYKNTTRVPKQDTEGAVDKSAKPDVHTQCASPYVDVQVMSSDEELEDTASTSAPQHTGNGTDPTATIRASVSVGNRGDPRNVGDGRGTTQRHDV